MAERIQPNFECDGCGHEIYGKEPVHCPKCTGMKFQKIRPLAVVGFNAATAAIGRIRRDAKDIRLAMVRMKHPSCRQIGGRMYAVEAAANKALRILTEATNPDEIRDMEQAKPAPAAGVAGQIGAAESCAVIAGTVGGKA